MKLRNFGKRCSICGGSGDIYIRVEHAGAIIRADCSACDGYGYFPDNFLKRFEDTPGGWNALWHLLSDDQKEDFTSEYLA